MRYQSPSVYIQQAGLLAQLGTHIKSFGTRACLVAHPMDVERVQPSLDIALSQGEIELIASQFQGECHEREVQRLVTLARSEECAVIIGLGGGKALDTAKAVAHYSALPVIIIPTIASTDAPCSAIAVIHAEDGRSASYLYLKRNPDMVLVDSSVIAQAPVRFLIAGMGDALSTYVEARSCYRTSDSSHNSSNNDQRRSVAGLAMAKACYDTILKDSLDAIEACQQKVVTPALDRIIEANILLSGIGFETGGLAAAHAIHNGLAELPETGAYMHGEKVAFTTICHLVLEGAPAYEIEEVIQYCRSVGLPTKLADIGIHEVDQHKLMAVARTACTAEQPMRNMPMVVSVEAVAEAIRKADILGS